MHTSAFHVSVLANFLLMAGLAAARPAVQASDLSARSLPDGVSNQVCAGPGTSYEPFDLLPQAKKADCQALLDTLISGREQDVQTGGGGELLTQTEADGDDGTKVVNYDPNFAFGTQISGSASNGQSSCVLELIAKDDNDESNGREQVTL
jgi:hypothetical protein